MCSFTPTHPCECQTLNYATNACKCQASSSHHKSPSISTLRAFCLCTLRFKKSHHISHHKHSAYTNISRAITYGCMIKPNPHRSQSPLISQTVRHHLRCVNVRMQIPWISCPTLIVHQTRRHVSAVAGNIGTMRLRDFMPCCDVVL